MKRLGALLLCAALLAGCSKQGREIKLPPISQDTQMLVTAETPQGEFSCVFRLTADGYTAEFLSPESVSGMCLSDTAGEKKLTYKGNEVPLSGNALSGSFPVLTAEALKKCMSGEATAEKKKDETAYSGDVDGAQFTLITGNDSLFPQKVTFPTLNTEVKFSKM